jgi:ribulose-phosphate 3-epimerase
MVLIMSVNPGFGGQKFIEHTYEKVRKIRQMSVTVIIEIDGGVTSKNAKKLVEAGANALVAGSFVFSSENPIQTIEDLKNI